MNLVPLVLALAGSPGHEALPFLNPIFSDHMVLQRDRPNTIWGWTTPGARVTVSIADQKASATAKTDGKWTVKISPPPAGGPYTVTVEGPQKVVLQDVLVGDVWVCSGQSNMEQGIQLCNDAAAEILAANHPSIRLAMIPRTIAFEPRKTVTTSWSVCTPETIAQGGWGGFSGVAYFFGRELSERLNVPIGLVQSCWGGTIAEAWTSRPGVARQGDFADRLTRVDQIADDPAGYDDRVLGAWFQQYIDAGWMKPDFDDSTWLHIARPGKFEHMGLRRFDGMVFLRGEFDLPGEITGESVLHLGNVDDGDMTFVNGKLIEITLGANEQRHYRLPAGTLKPGRNVIAVSVADTGGMGGFRGEPSNMAIVAADGRTVPLAQGKWRMRRGLGRTGLSPLPPLSTNPNAPTILYNGMIHPIQPLAIKGAIWYQGESNANRAYQYRELMPMLIQDWRRGFGQPDLPFFMVQLANFTQRRTEPGESEWAELREAQFMATQKLPHVGIAAAIDIGEAADIHPRNKQDVGFRLALSALKTAYGLAVEASGPVYRSMKREGQGIRITFDNVAGGLVGLSDRVAGFAIAGPDRKFVWADARIEGDTVVVSSPHIQKPVAVRYAWADNPELGIANRAGLPAFPFRTDNWPGLTIGRK